MTLARQDKSNLVMVLMLLVAALMAGGLYGLVAMLLGWWPSETVKQAHQAFVAYQEKFETRDPYKHTNFYWATPRQERGVAVDDPQRAYPGYTLFTSAHFNGALLINMQGEVVHRWELPFSEVWPSPEHVDSPLPDGFIFWRKAHLFPNGDVLAIFEAFGDTPYGYGLIKVDKDSRLIWKYAARAHHDLDVGPDGRIYVLTHEFVDEALPDSDVPQPYLADQVAVLSAGGEELQRVSILDAFRNSEFSGLVKNLGDARHPWDPLHTNSVEVLGPDQAEAFPFMKSGQLMISMRSVDLLAVLDLETQKITWAMKGPWHREHDADFLPNGNLLLFDNRGHLGVGGLSRILEVDPFTAAIEWQYTGTASRPLESFGKGSQQRLPNGNTLITESYLGRLLEVTPEGEIAWEYISPYRVEGESYRVATVCWGERVSESEMRFEPQNPVGIRSTE